MTERSPLHALLASHGALGKPTQRMMTLLADRGRAAEALQVLAAYLCEEGMRTGELPINAGIKEKQLVEIVKTTCPIIADRYRTEGGVLLAKAWCTDEDLAFAMQVYWERSFRPEIPVTERLDAKITQEEISDRTCVATLCAKAKWDELARQGKIDNDVDEVHRAPRYTILKEDLEMILGALVKTTLQAFDDPNTAQHRLLHPAETKTS